MRREGFAFHAVDTGLAIQRRNRNRERRFSQPVNRKLRLGTKSIPSKSRRKALQSLGIDWLGAVHRNAPRTQIEAYDIFVRDFSHAQLVREIRRSSNGSAILVKSPQ